MSRHQYDLVQCMKQPGAAVGYVCSGCDGRCPVCDSFVKPTTKVRVCVQCSAGHLTNKCILCGMNLDEDASPAYYCYECVRQDKDREGCPRIVNIGSSRSHLMMSKKKTAPLERLGNGVFLVGLVRVTDGGSASLSSGDSGTGSSHDNVEVHTVDTDTGVVLDTQVDVLVDTETKVSGLREVSLSQLVFLDLEASLQDLLSLWASDGDVHGDLFVSSDTEGSDGVSSLGLNWGLTRQLFQNLGGSGQSVTGLTDTNVQH